MRQNSKLQAIVLGVLSACSLAAGYEVQFSDADYSRQVCSGMWASQSTFINVTFDESSSQGQVAMVIYEWKDVKYLGVTTSTTDDSLPKTYVCTTDAVRSGLCAYDNVGKFIFSSDDGTTANQTTFWTASVALNQTGGASSDSSGLWESPEGNPTPPADNYTSPWRSPELHHSLRQSSDLLNPSPSGTVAYTQPIQYQVRTNGYYCVAILPVTVLNPTARQAPTDVPSHPTYNGVVLFRNTFDGQLPATDYPKVNFYLAMFFIYAIAGSVWAWLCYKHVTELLPIQYYLSSLVAFLVIEMVANWVYYRYLNAHGKTAASVVFLFVVAILDAGRNALSFFMLLVVSLGLSVVCESLGRTMLKCQILAGLHFVFGVLYAVGIVELELESTSALVLLMFVIPLAFTLSGFLMWILYSLNGTMTQLSVRKQRYKLRMFKRLYYILLGTVAIIAVFFVISSMSFSDRLAEDYAAKSWKIRWWLLDGYLALLYFFTFWSIAYLWRPSENNRRLAMSDEIAQEDEDAEDYDLETLQQRTVAREDDEITLVNSRREPEALAEDHVVFEIGDEDIGSDDEGETAVKKRRGGERRASGDRQDSADEERQGLIHKDRDE
ncbi:lung seven transmembrane receptor-domain-containing protein [Suillus subalutaceus]|uniref:lung seven transmembrane receptor-domain-containing protein n=1 Tax=Suillus subalutaceus TaxID=48586 RepID=UPI001B884361|nr:lung seven transmembrane receptor-domain-containing protein [Suillus subalutaceus]KAG1864765.1 lung seven transmembrane receptor-domain-containing protein [Suillus subalutaceus]KAG1885465.1 lung seven transmembrane receptor-domain-containing protein [Suillus subluteus]